MPVIVDQDYELELPTEAESSDGRLKATTHPAGGGVYLRADFSNLVPTPRKVRFVRGREALLPVRSGDPAWAPGGIAKAYDREAPGGVPSAWYAIPIFWSAGQYVEGAITAGVQLVSPAPTRKLDFWLKSINTPHQLRLRSTSAMSMKPERSLNGRDAGQPVPGQMYPSGGWDVPVVQPVTYVLKTHTRVEYDLLESLLAAGPMLVQQFADYGVSDEYVKLGTSSWHYFNRAIDPERVVTMTLNPCQRPPTAFSPLLIPGYSWADVDRSYLSWAHLASLVPTWDDLLLSELAPPAEITPETGGSGDEGGP